MKKLILAGLVSLALVGCGGSDKAEQAEATSNQTEASKDLGLTPKQINDGVETILKDAFSQISSDQAVKDWNTPIVVQDDMFVVNFSPALSLDGGIAKNGNVYEMKYSALAAQATPEEMMFFAFHAGALARTLSPELDKEQSAGEVVKLLSDVVTKASETKEVANNEVAIGKIVYKVGANPDKGILTLTVVPSE
ncbi:hypothetical protein B0181_05065 [Moraxella caviae]|uniref:Lipoprotein n=1 Tax=Moraxella caviae TaxID=34060 RepID=A0A1T0A3E7_9GAMM|nr:hypothetical protein [Moraxella caviae]OOR90244.1 hypothetical protein B0181_05065 [Moraxella caviae]STZ14532.1 Uncharacterised protein [Moraxella caviae]VEW12537.1 Uncharacterised protein [Moraxella caviae]